MLQAFQAYLQEKELIAEGQTTLLAVSGGLDSMVMLHLFNAAELPCAVAHCNFQLRGEASEADEELARQQARANHLPFYTRRFDTKAVASQRGISIQMAARELRYEWLERIRQDEGYDLIATAHHINDHIETLIYNLAKGCGLRGLLGIPVRNGKIIRPLSYASREMLEAFQQEQQISFREDASNATIKYSRNKIRHQVMPALKTINPSLEDTMADNFSRFQEADYLYRLMIGQIADQAWEETPNGRALKVEVLKKYRDGLPSLLYELLHTYGLNAGQVQQLATSVLEAKVGAIFYARQYKFLVDRELLFIKSRTEEDYDGAVFQLGKEHPLKELPGGVLELRRQEGQPEHYPEDEWQAFVDAEVIEFPLTLRHWQAGDQFQPLGMGGQHQKLKDYFNNNKVSRFEKERIWIIEDAGGRICWIAGYRLDDRFKIKPDTEAYWILNFIRK